MSVDIATVVAVSAGDWLYVVYGTIVTSLSNQRE